MAGPLAGIRIIELAGIGPAPFCGMMLADHGAEVIRVERPGARLDPEDPLGRSRRSIIVDMKQAAGVAVVRDLVRHADGFIEGFRPGVAERLGLGPDVLMKETPRLVYGRMTGWGQYGPYAQAAGHDINYIALSGVLHTVGEAGRRPIPPVNYVGDFGGGGMMLAFAMVSALLAVKMGGKGDVIDCAMTDGSALLAAMTWYGHAIGMNQDRPGVNLLDGGAHFYDTYETADGKYVAFGAIEPQFYAQFRQCLGIADDPDFAAQMDETAWPRLKQRVADIVRTRTRDEWCALMEATDVCFAPVLSLAEAPNHPHNLARGTFLELAQGVQPAPAPRYSGRSLTRPTPPTVAGADTDGVLSAMGYDAQRIGRLRESGAIQ
ncbi:MULTISPECIES: CaiB/BaiF CoA-transferase family protein [unclassified Azospirillum]|uniref:CaiB/BaiF CoA transferase family protein n=1 Tax=unclassified Azospirillum TaxID=2630922 RepID=UPI000B6F484A|nr:MULTISPECIES: CaiB/BaiF CoA-transferase family protein [unclassified Azospirillum]SNT08398.1 alpha-methylacyl-CoA racemase [Azospirillum sp. RU38E]SNT22915.1 alpha-methylacyl-CoA racemase [Azospirillum sp. RU37A]